MSGWIKLHRNIKSHWIYNEKPFSKYQAWMDILLSANHKDNKFMLGNELLEIERGSFITSELKLMNRWGWSKTKVRNFLKLLENDKMIVKIADRKKTTLTVVNYEVWQGEETTKEPQKNHKETNKKLIKDTNKNEKNVKNEKKYIYTDIFDHWLVQEIIIHREVTPRIIKAMDMALKEYRLEEIKDAISIYSEAYHSDFYFNHKYTLEKFLKQNNGIPDWIEEGSMYENYMSYLEKQEPEEEKKNNWDVDAS